MAENLRVPFTLEMVTLREGQTIRLAPQDRMEHVTSRDDLSLGGTLHTFAVLRSEERR